MIHVLKRWKTAFGKTFTDYPRATYNLLFWSVIFLVFLILYLTSETVNDRAAYVKKSIAALEDKKQLDTINRLLEGQDVSIRNFPFIKTYTIIPNKRSLAGNSNQQTGNVISSINTAFFPLSKNTYMVKDKRENVWKVHVLQSGSLFDENLTKGVGASWNFENRGDYSVSGDWSFVVPVRQINSNREDFLNIDAPETAYHLPDSLSSFRVTSMQSSENAIWFYLLHDSAGRRNLELRKIRFNKEGFYLESTPFFLKRDQYGLSSRKGFPDEGYLTQIGDTCFFTAFTFDGGPLFNRGAKVYNFLLPAIKPSDLNADFDAQILLWSDHLHKNIVADSGGKVLKFYQSGRDGWQIVKREKIRQGANASSKMIRVDDVLCMMYPKGDSIDIIKAIEGKDSIEYHFASLPVNSIFGAAVCFDKDSLFILSQDGQGFRRLISLNNKGVFRESTSDSMFLRWAKNGDVFMSMLGKSPEFVLAYPNSLATVSVQKIDGRYDYKIIGGINWPTDAFEVKDTIDSFYIILVVAFVITLYFSLYFSLRSFFANRIKPIDYDAPDSVFKKMPTLTGKVKMVENMVKILMLRSDTMLGLGIIFGVGGVLASIIVFQITENSVTSWNDPHTVMGIIRPVILLVFIETFTFFFLKQYRIIFNEYKLFYSVYLRLLNYYHIIECSIHLPEGNRVAIDIQEALISEKFDLYERNTRTAINEFDDNFILKLLDKYGEHINKGK